MRNSNSREQSGNPQSQKNRNTVPQPPKTPSTLTNTNINIATTSRKSATRKPVPPKPQSKLEYDMEVNMTESKIFKAKQGLQLLKKKMNRTGMSRQKSRSTAEKVDQNRYEELIVKKMVSKPQNKTEKEIAFKKNKQIPRNSKENEVPVNQATEPLRAQIKKTPSIIMNSQKTGEERQISKQVDFMELLQRQMQKEGAVSSVKRASSKREAANKIYDEHGEEIILHQCNMGCGRMFNQQTIQKHEKICHKVFQSKRKAFDSGQHRQIQSQGVKIPLNALKKGEEKTKKSKNEVPKWKLQSAKLRAGIKLSKNVPLSKEEEKAIQSDGDLKQCPYCGRKFNEKASQKHIPFCQRKSKEISKNATLKRK